MIEFLQGYLDTFIELFRELLLRRTFDWQNRKCVECGYWAIKGQHYKECHCRKYPNARIKDDACPDFVSRATPADTEEPE